MENKRLTELDGLRGLAALAVVLFHYIYHYDRIYGHSFEVSEVFKYGSYGVHLFFMVSGFVIYWTISKSEKPLDFIWSRFSRLYPVFWVALILTFLAVLVFSLPGRERSFNTFIANFSMFHEYLGYSHVDGAYWTLTLELAFYLWILTIFCIGQIKNIEKLLIFWVTFASIITFDNLGISIEPTIQKLFLLNYIELFAAGICFYKYKDKSYSNWTHLLFAASIGAVYASYPIEITLGLLGLFLIFFLVIQNRASVFSHKLIVYLGTISYSLYLIHQNIGYIVIRNFYSQGLNPLLGILVAITLSITIAHLLMIFVERPSLKFLREFYKHNDDMQRFRKRLAIFTQR